jgi:hypothetical protein
MTTQLKPVGTVLLTSAFLAPSLAGIVVFLAALPRDSAIADQALESLRKWAAEFGMTPAARTRIKVPTGSETVNEFDEFLRR